MKQKEFECWTKNILVRVEDLLLNIKKREYCPQDDMDRLIQFKRASLIRSRTPEDVCLDWFTKHFTSIEMLANKELKPTYYNIMEKIGDAIAYLVLLGALLIEQLDDIPQKEKEVIIHDNDGEPD